MVNLDTHVLVFALAGELKPREQKILASNPWGISSIVLWEIAKLSQRGRIGVDLEDNELSRILSRIHVWDLSPAVAMASCRLDFRGDPADEIIAATSIVHKVPLLTRDKRIHKSRLTPLA